MEKWQRTERLNPRKKKRGLKRRMKRKKKLDVKAIEKLFDGYTFDPERMLGRVEQVIINHDGMIIRVTKS